MLLLVGLLGCVCFFVGVLCCLFDFWLICGCLFALVCCLSFCFCVCLCCLIGRLTDCPFVYLFVCLFACLLACLLFVVVVVVQELIPTTGLNQAFLRTNPADRAKREATGLSKPQAKDKVGNCAVHSASTFSAFGGERSFGCGSKIGAQNGTLVKGKVDEHLRNPKS